MSFESLFHRMVLLGNTIIERFSPIMDVISGPPVEDGPLRDFLEGSSWLLTPHLNQWIDQFFPGDFVDTIWDLTLVDWAFAVPFVIMSFSILRFILSLIRG